MGLNLYKNLSLKVQKKASTKCEGFFNNEIMNLFQFGKHRFHLSALFAR